MCQEFGQLTALGNGGGSPCTGLIHLRWAVTRARLVAGLSLPVKMGKLGLARLSSFPGT